MFGLQVHCKKKYGHQNCKLRTNNEGEYVNHKFTNYFIVEGIQMQHIVPYTPRQNVVAKRKNHTLKEIENCMIQSKGFGPFFSEKTINCANHIVDWIPHRN